MNLIRRLPGRLKPDWRSERTESSGDLVADTAQQDRARLDCTQRLRSCLDLLQGRADVGDQRFEQIGLAAQRGQVPRLSTADGLWVDHDEAATDERAARADGAKRKTTLFDLWKPATAWLGPLRNRIDKPGFANRKMRMRLPPERLHGLVE